MTVNVNTPCRFTRGLDHCCKTFEFSNIAQSMRSRTRNFFHINVPGMGRFKLFDLVGYS